MANFGSLIKKVWNEQNSWMVASVAAVYLSAFWGLLYWLAFYAPRGS